jgi:hypothetical protein
MRFRLIQVSLYIYTLTDLIILSISFVDVFLHFILGKGLRDILDKWPVLVE